MECEIYLLVQALAGEDILKLLCLARLCGKIYYLYYAFFAKLFKEVIDLSKGNIEPLGE